MIPLLNANLKSKKVSLGENFQPIKTKSEFCEQMFPKPEEIDSKITCYSQVR